MAKPYVSIVMPIFRVENFLAESINDILNQTFSDFELILVDDKSPDRSGEICDEFAKKDPRIRVIHLENNGGAANARNVGIDEANGDYILFLDGDDRFDNNLIELAADSMKKNPAKAVVFGLLEHHYDKNGNIVLEKAASLEERILKTKSEVRNFIPEFELSDLYGYPVNKLFDLAFLRQSGARFPKMAFNEDIIFNIAFFMDADSCNIISDTPYIYKKRVNASTTSRFIPTYYEDIMVKVRKLYEQFEYFGINNEQNLSLVASRYVRYFFSALERNCHKRSNMNKKERKEFLLREFGTDLYKNLSPYMSGSGLSGIMAKALKSKNVFLCLSIARIIYLIKAYLPSLFKKIN